MTGESFLIVRLQGREFVVPSRTVNAVMSLRGQHLLAATPRGLFRKRLKVHGAMIPVGAPHEALGLPGPSISARTCLLIAERPQTNSAALRFGVIVDSVSRLETFAPKDVRSEAVRIHGKWRPVLNLDAMFSASAVAQAALSGNAA